MNRQSLLENLRKDFPALNRRRNGKPPIYMDSACTTLVPYQVISALNQYYTDYPACSGRRSQHWFAEEATRMIDGNAESGTAGARKTVSEFINAESEKEIIFTLNTTYAINMVALGFNFKPGDTVLLTGLEHNSNLVPWLRLQKSGLIQVRHFDAVDTGGFFDIEAFESFLKSTPVRLVSMAYTSNVTGVTLPAREIISIAHRYGARVLLDGAQAVPHRAVDVRSLDVDFLAFSMHKMCGPRGVGVLYGKKGLLEGGTNPQKGNDFIEPVILGGGTVDNTDYSSYIHAAVPDRFEAGIQNYAGIIASGAATEYIRQVGMDNIAVHEKQLNEYLTDKLLNRYGDSGWFTIAGPKEAGRRGGILTFVVQRPNAIGIAKELNNKSNIMIRDGVFCAHSYFNDRFGADWTHPKSHREHRMIYRVSFYLYNTFEECDVFADTLDEIFNERSYI